MSGPRSSGVLGWSVGLEFDNFRALITSPACLSNRPVVGGFIPSKQRLCGRSVLAYGGGGGDRSIQASHSIPPPVAEPRCTLMQGRGRCAGALLRSFNSQDRDIRSLTINQSISVSKVSHKGILIYTCCSGPFFVSCMLFVCLRGVSVSVSLSVSMYV